MRISEVFYSIQGEGVSAGVPAVFVRLAGCNLCCGISNQTLSQARKMSQIEIEQNKLNNASWVCDTIEVWLKGKEMSNEDIFNLLKEKGWLQHLHEGAHLIFTGGEPLMQQKQIVEFLSYYTRQNGSYPYIEFETNGTIKPDVNLQRFVKQWNISPKLSDSGMVIDERFKVDVWKYFFEYDIGGWAKFVVKNDDDVLEILGLIEQYEKITHLQFPTHKILLMPACGTREELIESAPTVVELCKKYNFRYSSREHLIIWNKKTGV